MRNILRVLPAVTAALLLASCGPNAEPEPGPSPTPTPDPKPDEKVEVTSVSLSETSISLEEGDTFTLTATVLPANADDKTVSWSSDNESVASVSDGRVTALSVGTAKVTAKAGGKSAVCKVTVKEKVYRAESVSLDLSAVELTEGESGALVATVLPEMAADKSVTWSVDRQDVVAIHPDGSSLTFDALKEGEAVITVSCNADNSLKASCRVKVNKLVIKPESITISLTEAELKEGDVLEISAAVGPDNATDRGVVWTVSDDTVVSLAADGNSVTATALRSGTVTVTAAASGDPALTAVCVITVKKEVEDVPVDQEGGVTYPEDDYGTFN